MHPLFTYLPPLRAYAWLLPLYLQAVLLHPRFPPTPSRALRLALAPVAVALALAAPGDCFRPRDVTRFWNAGFGFVALYGGMKAVEWGWVGERTGYDWVGFGAEGARKQAAYKVESRAGGWTGADEVTEARKKEGWVKVMLGQLHLMVSFRHLGYRSCTLPPPPPTTTRTFLRRTLTRWATSHATFTLGMAFVTLSVRDKNCVLLALAPWLRARPEWLALGRDAVASALVAGMACAGLALTHAIYSVGYCLAINVGRKVGLPLDRFEPREYGPLFGRPFLPTSVQRLWGREWQQLFRHLFLLFGTRAFSLSHHLGLPRPLAQLSAALAVVLATSALHEYALGSAIAGLDTLGPRSSLTQKHGGILFFATMVLLGGAEQAFRAATGRRVGGVAGFVWTIVGAGTAAMVFLNATWAPTYLLKGVPEPGEWSWVRWVVPLACGAPTPLWMKA